MKSILINQNTRFIFLLLLLTVVLTGCSIIEDPHVLDSPYKEGPIPYNGPKIRIAVARFTDKTGIGWYNKAKGEGMADQLITALVNTGRYIVLERHNVDAILEEQGFGKSGLVSKESAARMHRILGAQLLAVAAVTEFDVNTGWYGGGGAEYRRKSKKDLLGGVLGGLSHAHIGIDLRLIETETSHIIAAKNVEGEFVNFDIFGFIRGYTGRGGLGGGLAGWANTPLEKALRQVINKAVGAIVLETDAYYVHGTSSNSKGDNTLRPVQRKLNNMGYEAGLEDGIWGPKTQNAVFKFQTDHQLEATGKLDQTTIQVIFSKWKDIVRSVQRKLNNMSYEAGPEDGIWGPKTKKAVSKFQTDHQLKATGKIDQTTIQKIKESS